MAVPRAPAVAASVAAAPKYTSRRVPSASADRRWTRFGLMVHLRRGKRQREGYLQHDTPIDGHTPMWRVISRSRCRDWHVAHHPSSFQDDLAGWGLLAEDRPYHQAGHLRRHRLDVVGV